MNPRSAIVPWRFMSSAVLLAVAVIAFTQGAWIVGVVALGLTMILIAIRIYLFVIFRRAQARAAQTPPIRTTPESVRTRMRILRLGYVVVFGLAAVTGVVGGLLLPNQLAILGWTLAGAFSFFIVLIVVATSVAQRRALSRLGEQP